MTKIYRVSAIMPRIYSHPFWIWENSVQLCCLHYFCDYVKNVRHWDCSFLSDRWWDYFLGRILIEICLYCRNYPITNLNNLYFTKPWSNTSMIYTYIGLAEEGKTNMELGNPLLRMDLMHFFISFASHINPHQHILYCEWSYRAGEEKI